MSKNSIPSLKIFYNILCEFNKATKPPKSPHPKKVGYRLLKRIFISGYPLTSHPPLHLDSVKSYRIYPKETKKKGSSVVSPYLTGAHIKLLTHEKDPLIEKSRIILSCFVACLTYRTPMNSMSWLLMLLYAVKYNYLDIVSHCIHMFLDSQNFPYRSNMDARR